MISEKHLQELLNRRPNRWSNLTIKEFERDISILQNAVLELQKTDEKAEKKSKDYQYYWDEERQRFILLHKGQELDEFRTEKGLEMYLKHAAGIQKGIELSDDEAK